MSEPTIKFQYAIFCDDIRTEDNGKGLFVGVYTGGISFSSVPHKFRFCAFLQCSSMVEVASLDPNGQTELEIQFEMAHDGGGPVSTQNPLKIPHSIMVDSISGFSAMLIGPTIEIKGPGILTLKVRELGQEWIDVAQKRVGIMSAPSSAP